MTLSIIIPNYNGENLLKNNLSGVLDAVKDFKGSSEIIISDDASGDNSVEVVKDFFLSIKEKNIRGILVENKNRKEGGFSKNVNRAVEKATGEILILLNTDVSPHKNFLPFLLKHFNDKNVFAVGCMDESIEGDKKILRGRGVGKWKRGFLMHERGEVDKDTTLWVSGGSGAFRKDIWDRLGGLDELYNPYYWEDIDISYRALKAGYKLVFEKNSVVVHDHEKGSIQSNSKRMRIRTIAYRNQFIFVWKNITEKSYLFSHLAWLPYHFWKAIVMGEYAFFVGIFHALFSLPKIMISRRNAQKLFIKTDKEILRNIAS